MYAKVFIHTDAFAFGMVMWECFSMQRAFAGAHNDGEVQLMIKSGDRPDLTKVAEVIGGISVRDIVAACWEQGTIGGASNVTTHFTFVISPLFVNPRA